MLDVMPVPVQQFLDNNGAPLAGGQVFTYTAGTTTPKATYTDSSGNTANPNPVVLDSSGRAAIWLAGGTYKVVLEDANGNVIWTADNIDNIQSNSSYTFDQISPMTSLGDIIYGATSGSGTRLPGNTSTTKEFLTQTGDGTNSAAPAWGTIQSTDLPTIAIAQGGTGQTTQQAAINALTGTQSAGKFLRSDGTNATLSSIQASDVPTLNQNTTGTAADLSTTLAISSGGTGQTTASAAFDAFSPVTTKGDLIVGSGTNTTTRLGVGTDGYVLTAKSSATNGVDWEANSSLSNPMTTLGDMISGGTSGTPTRVPGTTLGFPAYLAQAGNGSGAAIAPVWTRFLAPTIQKFTSGSGTYYATVFFYTDSASATVGAVYEDSASNQFTVSDTISSAYLLQTTATGGSAPSLPSGTLTKVSGTGDSSITYNYSRVPLALEVEMAGGGAGGGGGGSSVTSGSAGNNTTFGSSFLTADGGNNNNGTTPGSGGSASIGSGATGVSFTGQAGQGGVNTPTGYPNSGGQGGGSAFFNGGGSGSYGSTTGGTAVANSGGGGGGGGTPGTYYSGAGGGAGGSLRALISSPSISYSYSVGSGGAGGSAGTNSAGGAGAAGIIIVKEMYQ